MRLVVELVASASQQKDTHTSSYGDVIAFMLQCVVDIVVYGTFVKMRRSSHKFHSCFVLRT